MVGKRFGKAISTESLWPRSRQTRRSLVWLASVTCSLWVVGRSWGCSDLKAGTPERWWGSGRQTNGVGNLSCNYPRLSVVSPPESIFSNNSSRFALTL